MQRGVLFALIPLFVVAVGGCTTSLPEYPGSWAPIADGCEPPAGNFQNLGEQADKGVHALATDDYLLSYLMDLDSCEFKCSVTQVDRISLDPEPDGKVLMRAWRGPELHLLRVLAGDCPDGRWEITGGWSAATGLDAAQAVGVGILSLGMVSGDFATNKRRAIIRASDGSLVIHDRSQSAGVFLLYLPRRSDSARWVRFRSAEP